MENNDVKEQVTTAWGTVELELEAYKTDKNERHLVVAVVMASVALEAFFNNIVELYRKEQFPKFDSVQWTLKRFRRGVKFLNPSLVVNDLDGWKEVRELFDLRSQIVHNKVKTWERTDEKVNAVKIFAFSLRDHLSWNNPLLEGQFDTPTEQRFQTFFTPFL